jgi:hypothetical protein
LNVSFLQPFFDKLWVFLDGGSGHYKAFTTSSPVSSSWCHRPIRAVFCSTVLWRLSKSLSRKAVGILRFGSDYSKACDFQGRYSKTQINLYYYIVRTSDVVQISHLIQYSWAGDSEIWRRTIEEARARCGLSRH